MRAIVNAGRDSELSIIFMKHTKIKENRSVSS